MSTRFAMNYQRLYELDITPNGASRTWVRLAKGLTGADPSYNEESDQTAYLDNDGFKETNVTAKQNTFSFSGHRVVGDSAQDYIFALANALGDDLKTNFRYTDEQGNKKEGACTLANIDDGGGDAGSKVEVSFEIHLNGKPTITPAVEADALTATVAAGAATGTTKFTASAPVGEALAFTLNAASVGTVYEDAYLERYTPYTSGADIPATAGQYLAMYLIDTKKRVKKFLEQLLDSGDIKA